LVRHLSLCSAHFGNNAFSSAVISAEGNPDYGQQHPIQGTIPAQGAHLGIPSSQGPWNPWKGPVPLPGMSIGGNPFHTQWNPGQGSTPMPIGSTGGNPSQNPWNTMQAQPFTSYYGNHLMMSQQAQNLYTGMAMVITRALANNLTFPGNLVPVKLQAPFSLATIHNPNYHFWKPCTCQT
jgi:hypothetical protein